MTVANVKKENNAVIFGEENREIVCVSISEIEKILNLEPGRFLSKNYNVSVQKPIGYSGSKVVLHLSGPIKAVSKKTTKDSPFKDAVLFEENELVIMDNSVLIPMFKDFRDFSIVKFIGGKELLNYLIFQCRSSDGKFGILSAVPINSTLPRYTSIFRCNNFYSVRVMYTMSSSSVMSIPNIPNMSKIKLRALNEKFDDDDTLKISMQKQGLKNNIENFDCIKDIARATMGLIYSTVNPKMIFDILNINKEICKHR